MNAWETMEAAAVKLLKINLCHVKEPVCRSCDSGCFVVDIDECLGNNGGCEQLCVGHATLVVLL